MFEKDTLRMLNMRWILLSAIAFFITILFIALRSRVGFGPILAAGIISYISAWLALRTARQRGNRSLIAAFAYHLMTWAFILWAVSFVLVEFNVVTAGKRVGGVSSDYVIVLGAGLKGEEPSISLSSRLQKASEYLGQNPDAKVIVSGGRGNGESISEAEAMKRYLVNKGIEEKRIIKEEQSTSTRENLLFSKDILDDYHATGNEKLVVITSDYHAFRTGMIAEDIGLKISVISSLTPLYVYISGCVREYFAVLSVFFNIT